jgi:hypothetical protein
MTNAASTSFRDFADKSYLKPQSFSAGDATVTVTQKIVGTVSLILMFAAVGGMLLLGSIPPQ